MFQIYLAIFLYIWALVGIIYSFYRLDHELPDQLSHHQKKIDITLGCVALLYIYMLSYVDRYLFPRVNLEKPKIAIAISLFVIVLWFTSVVIAGFIRFLLEV